MQVNSIVRLLSGGYSVEKCLGSICGVVDAGCVLASDKLYLHVTQVGWHAVCHYSVGICLGSVCNVNFEVDVGSVHEDQARCHAVW